MDLQLPGIIIHRINRVPFKEAGTDPDGLPYAVLAAPLGWAYLNPVTVEFTYTGESLLRYDYRGVIWYLRFEEELGTISTRTPSWRQECSVPTVGGGEWTFETRNSVIYRSAPPPVTWKTPFTGSVFINSLWAEGYTEPRKYYLRIEWGAGALAAEGYYRRMGEFRIKEVTCRVSIAHTMERPTRVEVTPEPVLEPLEPVEPEEPLVPLELEEFVPPESLPSNFFSSMRGWFLKATQWLVDAAYLSYTTWIIPDFIGDIFNNLSDFTAGVQADLYHASYWWEDAAPRIFEILSWDTIWEYIKAYIPNWDKIGRWFAGWDDYVLYYVRSWWYGASSTVRGWISAATEGIYSLRAAWSDFWGYTWPQYIASLNSLQSAWSNFWSVTYPDLVSFDWLTTWWRDRLLDAQALINSAFVEREPFWSGWQDWRDQVVEFFTDPEEWLYKAVDRIIERFW